MSKMQIRKIAKGSWQKSFMNELIKYGKTESPLRYVKGRAASYLSKYRISLENMLKRAEAEGVRIKRIPGVRGGEWSAVYIIEQ